MTKRQRYFWIEVVLLALIVGAISTAIVASEMQPLKKNDIKMNVSDLRSFAATGHQLTVQRDGQHLTEQFFATEVQLLREKVSSTKKALESPADTDAESDRREAADISTQLSNAVEYLSAGRTNGSATRGTFELIQTRSKQLEDRLTHE